MKSVQSYLTKNIYILSGVSLLTDMASEMLYPVMPLYLKQIGYGVVAIGIIEGIADALSGLGKGVFGYISDKTGKRVLLLRIGYGLSAVSKPLMGIAANIGIVFGGRLLDRFGKGIRSAPRDAILAIESSPENRGKVFGFHRAMDTLGGTLGPVIALIYLYYYPGQYSRLFFFVAIPGALAVLLTSMISDKTVVSAAPAAAPKKQTFSFKKFLQTAPLGYKKLVGGLAVFALLNSSDMFLLLRAKELGLQDTAIIGAYVLYNAVYTIAAFPVGFISDKIGYKKIYIFGLILFGVVYSSFAREMSVPMLLGVFAVYGIFSAIHESVSKAWISRFLTPQTQGTGQGLYLSVQSVAFLITSIVSAVVWAQFGAERMFSAVSLLSLGLIVYFTFTRFSIKSSSPS